MPESAAEAKGQEQAGGTGRAGEDGEGGRGGGAGLRRGAGTGRVVTPNWKLSAFLLEAGLSRPPARQAP